MSNEIEILIEDEIKASYLDYSMSVIVSRALPDVRDGLKPVHRRILYAMNELGMSHDKPHKKSARIVGEVLGKYHPHGDSAVYQTMVRMAQDFNYRYMLVDGHGNFGSIDGDGAAAMRYTEARMSKITQELLADIDKNTIDFRKNFDDSLDEPVVLPAKLPHLLLNGTAGIAVGMATNIPPHNLGELVDGIFALIDDADISIAELAARIKGPDFPTGGIINGTEGIYEAYSTGRGKVVMRGKVEIEEKKNGREAIIIRELPYQVNKAKLIEKIAELVRDKKITGISDLRDESDREGIRVVIELKRSENYELILNKLYKYTELQSTFGIIMLALVDNAPKILNLKDILNHYLKHRVEVITRRTKFELDKAEKRAHILEGFRIALDHIDEIIRIIRGSKDTQEAMSGLISRFAFSDAQARAILDMRLQRLTGLERNKIEEEYAELVKEISRLKGILADEQEVYNIIKTELSFLKETYGDERRTVIESKRREIGIEDLIKDENVIVTVTNRGYIKRINTDSYKAQNRGGKGIAAHATIEEDFVEQMYEANKLDVLMIFTNIGKVHHINVYDVPEASRQARGKLLENLINLQPGEKVKVIKKIRNFDDNQGVFFLTKHGIVKKTKLGEFKNINRAGLRAINIKDGDDIIYVDLTTGNSEIFIATKQGYSIRFHENDLRSLGRTASGVIGIKLRKNDEVVSGVIISNSDSDILTITEHGFGKRTKISEYNLQSRSGLGVINTKVTDKIGKVVDVKEINADEDIMLITSNGILIRTSIENIPLIGRATQGVTIMKVAHGETVVSVAKIIKEEIPEIENEENEEK